MCAAIFGSGMPSWSAALFRNIYGYVGSGLSVAAGISLLVGIVYLVWGEKTGK
jgi:hypothetical protein